MKSLGIWENIYLRCLEIDKARGTTDSLEELSVQLSTINETIPPDIDPAEDFEYFVISKLCLSTAELLDQHLSELGDQES